MDGKLDFRPGSAASSSVEFTIETPSVNTGLAPFNRQLMDADWFDGVKHPTIRFRSTKMEATGGNSWFNSAKVPQATFTSTSVKALGGGKFEFAGKLAIKGISQPVVVPVTLTQNSGVTKAVGSFTLKRLDFKIGDGEWNDVSIVANEVAVNVKLALTGIAPL
jgi:polyisoprenoid-binding protein YceI